MSTGDEAPRDEFDSFLESTAHEGEARQEFQRRLLELTPTVNDTLRTLAIPLLQDASDQEINANLALLLLQTLEQEIQSHTREDAIILAKIKVNGIVTRQAITILDIKSLMMEGDDDPLHADARKQHAIARRLYTQEFALGDEWFTAYDVLIPGNSFDGESADAQRGYFDAQQDAARREAQQAARSAFTDDLTALVLRETEDVVVAGNVVARISTQLLTYKLYPANSEAAIDEILRESHLLTLKPLVMFLLEDFINPPSL